MNDEKRQLRILKRQLKRAGTRKLRRFLKDVEASAEDFQLGRNRTAPLNEKRKRKEQRPRQARGMSLPAIEELERSDRDD